MFPIILTLGPFKIYAFGVFSALGFLLSMIVLNKLAKRVALQTVFLLDYLIPLLIVGLAAARLVHVVLKWPLYQGNLLETLYIWQGGLSLWGALWGIGLYFWYLCWRHKQNTLLWFDQIALAIQVAFTFGLLGYLLSPAGLSGASFGTPTSLPWGMNFEELASPYAGQAVHPVTIYLILGHILILTGLGFMSRAKIKTGWIFYSACLVQGLLLFLTEPLKATAGYTLLNFNFALLVAGAFTLLGLWGLIKLYFSHRAKKSVPSLNN